MNENEIERKQQQQQQNDRLKYDLADDFWCDKHTQWDT